jgi:nucleotide-binding universal stress UspA family protein
MLQPQVRSGPLAENFGPPARLYKRIPVGYDDSASSEAALRTGRELALMAKADLFVAAIDRLPNSDSAEAFQAAVDGMLRQYQENFYRLRIAGLNEGIRVETFIALGDPAAYLVRKARQLRASLLIVAAAFGLSGQQADSVCERIVRDAACSVLVIPSTAAGHRT